MESGCDIEKQSHDGSVWIPQTPAKSTPARSKSEDILSVGTISSEISANEHDGLNQSDEKAVNALSFTSSASILISTPSEKVSIKIKSKHRKKGRYRPKVVKEGKIQKTPKPKTPNPLTSKPCNRKLPKQRTSKKILGDKSDIVLNDILKASQDIYPGVSPHISTEASSSGVSLENFDINVQVNGSEALPPPAEECGDNKLVELKLGDVSRSCRRALNFDLLVENDRKLHTEDGNASCASSQRDEISSQVIVYQRRSTKFNVRNSGSSWQRGEKSNQILVYHRRRSRKIILQNHRKFGPDFPNKFKKQRTKRTTTFLNFFTSLLAVARQNGVIDNPLRSAIAAKNAKLNMIKKKRMGRIKKLFTTLPSLLSTCGEKSREPLNITKGEKSCERPSISYKISERQPTLIPVERNSAVDNPKSIITNIVPSLSTSGERIKNVSTPKLYWGILTPCFSPPLKKLRGIEYILKKLEHLHIGDVVKKPGPRKKSTSLVAKKHGELVLYETKKKVVPRVAIDQETEREWNLLLQVFSGGADEERGEDREKWWEEQRRIFRVRMLTFVAIMHIVQGDRRFSEWKGSVVDSVVGVFLTQNVSDHLSSNAFMSLASRFPLKPKNELEFVSSSCTETIPIVQEFEPGRSDSYLNNHPLEREGVAQVETPSIARDSDNSQAEPIDWDELRKTYSDGVEEDTTGRYSDSVDWEAVRLAPPIEVSEAIKMRGQHVVIGGKIQAFLNRLVKDHGSIDLEWLRNVPPDKAKDYLLSYYGLGLKSVECIRLLCLHHHAFPVDINVARVAVRLGWVPLQPLPGGLEFHLLKEYPIMDTVQVYLWPRLCTLDQKTLYELHYQMITFGKVFCKKSRPSCGTCPMRGECKHHASEIASSRRSLPSTGDKSTSSAIVSISSVDDPSLVNATPTKSYPQSSYQNNNVEPIVEYPPSPVHVSGKNLVRDIEDWYGQSDDEDVYVNEDEDAIPNVDGDDIPINRIGSEEWNVSEDDIPTIKLAPEELKKRFRDSMLESNIFLPEDDVSKAIVSLTSEASSIPTPKLKNISRLKTVHHVYEIPDNHPILAEVQRREPDDPTPYLLVIWASDGDNVRSQPFKSRSCSQKSEPNDAEATCSTNTTEDENLETVPGTLMIPCRTANKGSFPLNGTYFQVNEVFADDESSEHPIQVPRKWLWNLRRRFLYCGSSASAIFTGIPIEEIQHCFWRGFICVRAFDRRTKAPVDLPDKFHQSTSVQKKGKRKISPDNLGS